MAFLKCSNTLRLLLTTLQALLVVVPIILSLALATLLFLPYRLLVLAIAKILRPDLLDIVSGGITAGLSINCSTVPTSNLCFHVIVDGDLTADEVRERFRTQVLTTTWKKGSLKFDKLKQVIVPFMGYRFFRSADSFDLNVHVRHFEFNSGMRTKVETEEDLKAITGAWVATPWEVDRSPWEVLVIQGFRGEGQAERRQTVLCIRINHALADGYSFLDMLYAALDPGVEAPKYKQKSTPWTFARAWKEVKMWSTVVWDVAAVMTDSNLSADSEWTMRDEPRKPDMMSVFTGPIPVEKIKEIKNKFGVSYPSVLVNALTLSFHRILSEAGKRVPEAVLCSYPLPKAGHPGGLTNHLSACTFALPVVSGRDTNSLRIIDQKLAAASNSYAPKVVMLLSDMTALLPDFATRWAYKMPKLNVAFGIVPAITEPLYLRGHLISGMILCGVNLAFPASDGMNVSLSGANNMQRVCISVYKSLFPYPELFNRVGDYLEEEIDWMLKEASLGAEVV